MSHPDKPVKSGFVIKLSNETVQKLQETETAVQEPISSSKNSEDDTIPTQEKADDSASAKEDVECTIADAKEEIESEQGAVAKPSNELPTDVKTDEKQSDAGSGEAKVGSDWGEYASYVTYEGETAVYTDPSTKQEYAWSTASNSWAPRSSDSTVQGPERTYSYENDTHIYTETDGSKFFWDDDKKAWFPKVDDDFLAHYQMSYGFVDNTSKEEKPAPAKKAPDIGPPKRKAPEEAKWFDASDDKGNTKVYVSNLPEDLTEEEFVDLMQKCGLVMRDPSSQKMKVKLYYDKESGCFKGDALCTYIKVESVELALKLIDGSDVRGRKITVQPAQFQMKGDYNPALKPKKRKKKELEKIKRMQQKLFDWRPEKALGERSKNERVVIVKNLFDPTDFDKEVQLILDYQQDLREECGKCGEVRKVVLYDRHPEGVAQITMKEPAEADACVTLINDRWFGKRKLSAEIWDGRTKYRIAETDADMSKRVDKWGKFLEGADGEKTGETVNSADGSGKSVDEPGKTVDEPRKNVEEPGKNVEEPGKSLEEPGKSVEEPGKNVEEPGKSLEEPGKSVDEPGKNVEEPGKSFEKPGKNVDETRNTFEPDSSQDVKTIEVKNTDSTENDLMDTSTAESN